MDRHDRSAETNTLRESVGYRSNTVVRLTLFAVCNSLAPLAVDAFDVVYGLKVG